MITRTLILATTTVLAMSAAQAAETKGAETKDTVAKGMAQIPFANNGGIDDWRANDDKVIYVKGRDRQWYKGELISDCIGLRFADQIAFDTDASGTFTKFSAIVVEGKKCPLISLDKTDAPPSKKAPSKKDGDKKS